MSQKSALVTGASSGIGHATAIEFAKQGYKVFAAARRLDPMRDLEQHGIVLLQLDVLSLESVRAAKKFIIDHNGAETLDVLYNNAGQSCTFPALDASDDNIQQCFDVNVFGPMRLVRELSPLLINAKGVIGFSGSLLGLLPFPFLCVYSSTKAAIHQYAATLRIEMKPFGVKVINIVIGGVRTNIEDTRPLPQDSIYNFPEAQEPFKFRQAMARKSNPMDADVFARKVVADFQNAQISGKLNIYRGAKATFLSWVIVLVPRFILENILIRKFRLTKVYEILARKYPKLQ